MAQLASPLILQLRLLHRVPKGSWPIHRSHCAAPRRAPPPPPISTRPFHLTDLVNQSGSKLSPAISSAFRLNLARIKTHTIFLNLRYEEHPSGLGRQDIIRNAQFVTHAWMGDLYEEWRKTGRL